ncbi:MAG: sulfatase-like hydrolase/transferase [Armatimonadetes bacterium]|nr:sulfatase-like hydrolase/transferase [Armatimonadota bacterium]
MTNKDFEGKAGHALPDKVDEDQLARIFAMITNVDQNVGRLFDKLKELDVFNETLIIFLNDNGPNTRRYVQGMRGMKSEVYEGGVRSPLWLHWPGVLEEGRESDMVSAHIDVLPTVLEACGIQKPDGLELDGRSIWPLLTEEDLSWPDRNIVIKAHRGDEPQRYHNFLVRNQRWKLLHASNFGRDRFNGEPDFELYDMQSDPLETNNVAPDNPDLVEELRRVYDRWFDDVGSTRPDNYGPVRVWAVSPDGIPVVLHRHEWRVPPEDQRFGTWVLHVPRDTRADIKVYFRDPPEQGKAVIDLNGSEIESEAEEGGWYVFMNVSLVEGALDLRSHLLHGQGRTVAWQIQIVRKDQL